MLRSSSLGLAGAWAFFFFLAPLAMEGQVGSVDAAEQSLASPQEVLFLLEGDREEKKLARKKIQDTWHPGYAPMLVEVLNFTNDRATGIFLVTTLEKHTGQKLGYDIQGWFEWIWNQEENSHPLYAEFKSLLYRSIDPRFGGYFSTERVSRIRLDEVRWGGVHQDGIPPLRSPKMLKAAEARYLKDSNVVFGIEVRGDARAYPKRILAWHEMFTDAVGGIPVAGVYCTLCGTVILYETKVRGMAHEIGTSGFLYRSNKLMYDRATQSLWSTLEGKPVIGPLVGEGIRLPRRSVVTTTWGEWKRRHPETLVLSRETGYRRDYSEGAAYREYFATDELMFNVPKVDTRLKNKAEVLTLLFDAHPGEPLAISAAFLEKQPVYHDVVGDLSFVVLTDRSGANRVYRSSGVRFLRWDQDRTATDVDGKAWTLSEAGLHGPEGQTLDRLPAQRAFWFGWYAAFPGTRLVR